MKRLIIFMSFLFFIYVACEMKLPLKEMTTAKTKITRAFEVKADKYAPEELEAAKNELFKTHTLIKEEKDDDAKKSAEKTIELADIAINKALPLLANDSYTKANEIFIKLEPIMASEFAPEQYNIAKEKIEESKNLLDNNDYWNSHLKSIDAYNAAISAEQTALAQSTVIESKISSINDSADEIKNNQGEKYASVELNKISEELTNARSSLDEKNFVKSFEHIKAAEENLTIANSKSNEYFISQKITSAKNLTSNLKSSKFAQNFKTEIDSIENKISKSEEELAKLVYDNARIEIDAALVEIDSLTIMMQKKEEEFRLAMKSKNEKKIDTNNKAGEYPKSYVVQYNPKNRDCLWKIAFKLYNDARLWPLIFITNRDQIKNPDLIFPGQKFLIPSSDKKNLIPLLIKKIRKNEEFGEDLEKEFSIYLNSQEAKIEEKKIDETKDEAPLNDMNDKPSEKKPIENNNINTDPNNNPDNFPDDNNTNNNNIDENDNRDTLTDSL